MRRIRCRADAIRVEVKPAVVRGFNGVMLGKRPVLVASDGAVCFRTSILPAGHSDS